MHSRTKMSITFKTIHLQLDSVGLHPLSKDSMAFHSLGTEHSKTEQMGDNSRSTENESNRVTDSVQSSFYFMQGCNLFKRFQQPACCMCVYDPT